MKRKTAADRILDYWASPEWKAAQDKAKAELEASGVRAMPLWSDEKFKAYQGLTRRY